MRNAIYMLVILPLLLLQWAAPFLVIYALIKLFS
jgi:hypothetical protein